MISGKTDVLVFTRQDAEPTALVFKACLGGGSAEFWHRFICQKHQQACTLVTLLKCNNRVFNYFGKYAVIDVFLPFSLKDIISVLHVDI